MVRCFVFEKMYLKNLSSMSTWTLVIADSRDRSERSIDCSEKREKNTFGNLSLTQASIFRISVFLYVTPYI